MRSCHLIRPFDVTDARSMCTLNTEVNEGTVDSLSLLCLCFLSFFCWAAWSNSAAVFIHCLLEEKKKKEKWAMVTYFSHSSGRPRVAVLQSVGWGAGAVARRSHTEVGQRQGLCLVNGLSNSRESCKWSIYYMPRTVHGGLRSLRTFTPIASTGTKAEKIQYCLSYSSETTTKYSCHSWLPTQLLLSSPRQVVKTS